MQTWASPHPSSVQCVTVLLANASSIAWIPETKFLYYVLFIFFQAINVYYSDKCPWNIKHWGWDEIQDRPETGGK